MVLNFRTMNYRQALGIDNQRVDFDDLIFRETSAYGPSIWPVMSSRFGHGRKQLSCDSGRGVQSQKAKLTDFYSDRSRGN